MSLRKDHPEMWADFVNAIRESVGDDWTEDQIAAVASKVRSTDPDRLLEDIGRVFNWCAAAMRSGDDEAIATVELWQMPDLPIEIEVDDDGGITHRLDAEPRP